MGLCILELNHNLSFNLEGLEGEQKVDYIAGT